MHSHQLATVLKHILSDEDIVATILNNPVNITDAGITSEAEAVVESLLNAYHTFYSDRCQFQEYMVKVLSNAPKMVHLYDHSSKLNDEPKLDLSPKAVNRSLKPVKAVNISGSANTVPLGDSNYGT